MRQQGPRIKTLQYNSCEGCSYFEPTTFEKGVCKAANEGLGRQIHNSGKLKKTPEWCPLISNAKVFR